MHIAVAAIYLVYASAPIRCSDTYRFIANDSTAVSRGNIEDVASA